MPRSYAQSDDLVCPQCGRTFSAEVWLIVDAGERPDLLARARAGELHDVPCPHCGGSGTMDAPLLIYLPDPTQGQPPLIFSPAQQSSREQTQQQGSALLGILAGALGPAWQDAWWEQIATVPRPLLPAVLSDDPAAALRQMQAEMAATLDRLRTEDPAAYHQLEEAARQAAQDAGSADDEHDDEEEGDDLPPPVRATLAAIIDELRVAGVTVDSPEDLQAALAAHPDLQARLEAALRVAMEEGDLTGDFSAAEEGNESESPLLRTLEAFVQARSWDESQRIIEQHPELLSDDADDLLGVLVDAYRARQEQDAVALLSEHRTLLRRCREAGIPRAFAEKMLPPEGIAEAQRLGVAPEELLAQMRTAQEMPPALRDVLAELAASGVEIRSPEDLEAALAARPDLRARLEAAMPAMDGGAAGGASGVPVGVQFILQELSQSAPRTEMARRARLCMQALALVSRDANPPRWAALHVELGNSLTQSLSGDRAENFEQAIAAYQEALQVMTREAMPVEWAQVMINLATAYYSRIRGDRAENIEQAIATYQQSLEMATRQAMPVEWAACTMGLANAYYSRIRGDRADNIEQAIDAYQEALEVRTRQGMPVEWAEVMNNLANAHATRVRGDRADNIEQAIAAYQQALEVRTWQAMPVEWATAMMNLATAYADRIRGDRAENIEQAIAAYQQVLRVITRQAMPVEWAQAMMNLAIAYYSRIRGDRAENIELAIAAYRQSLEVVTHQAMLVEWATVMMNLATAYANRVRGDPAENIELAIAAYQEVLEVNTRQAMPVEWAEAMMNLATAYYSRIRGDRAENIEQSITAYQQALEVRTRQAMPVEWAQAMMNLANAYYSRIRGDRAENIELAIAAYQQALQVRTRQAMPVEWATSMMNLATAYADRIRDDRAENIELAIAAYLQALDIFKPAALPVDCRRTARSLGNLLFDEKRFGQAVTPYRLAIQASDILFRQSFFREGREAELAETQGLPARAAYALAQTGNLEASVEALEQGRARLLAEVLEANRRDLERLPELGHGEVLARYRQASDHIDALRAQAAQPPAAPAAQAAPPRDFAAFSQEIQAASDELDAAIAAIRDVEVDGQKPYTDFLLPPPFARTRQAAQTGAPLVYLLATPAGGLALIVTPTGVEPPLRLDFSKSDLDALLYDQDGAGRYLRGAFSGDWATLRRSLTAALPLLGERVMGPLASKLAELGSQAVTLIPTGRLGLLPLHAAPIDAVTFADRFATAYAPSALALLHNRARRTPAARAFLAVGDPQPQEGEQVDRALVHLEPLLRQASTSFGAGSILSGAAATVERLRQELQQPPAHLLLGCHGEFMANTPLDSGLKLFDGRFTVRQLIAGTRLQGIALVTLCACQSSLSDFRRTPDEFTGLPGGFIQAGAQAVIGALWPVAAFPTALLFQHFYELLAAGAAPAVALHQAAAWLRDLSAAEYRRARGRLLQTASARAAFYIELSAPRDVGDRPFADPIYWAAFTFSGELAPAV